MPLKRVADAGTPVYLVPGNHERSEIPFDMLALHPRIHIFDRPRTFVADVNGVRLALSGFPFCRENVRARFRTLVEQTGMPTSPADVRLLCVHQCFEGAVVGPSDYMFRSANDVVRMFDVPADCSAVLAGHIHRHQVLTKDLRGRDVPAPVLYPGSIERTSFAEMDEPKGYLILEVGTDGSQGGALKRWEFRQLPARPMISRDLEAGSTESADLERAIKDAIASVPQDAILRLRINGQLSPENVALLSAKNLRAIAPTTMNVEVRQLNVE